MSERRAGLLPEQPRGTQGYRPTQREDEDRLTQVIIHLASRYGRYGHRRITALLQHAGWQMGKDGVERISALNMTGNRSSHLIHSGARRYQANLRNGIRHGTLLAG